MSLKDWLRSNLLDALAQRNDRYYWRQPSQPCRPRDGARLCLWQPDGKLGDSIIHTQLVAGLLRQRPDMRVLIVCAPSLVELWQRLPGVHQVIGARSWREAVRALGPNPEPIDVFVSMEAFLSLDTAQFMRTAKPEVSIGLNVGRYRAFTYSVSDHTFDHPRRHVTDRLRAVSELLGLSYHDESDLIEPSGGAITARVRLPEAMPHILLNTYGAGVQKKFSPDVIAWLIQEVRTCRPDARILFNVPTTERQTFEQEHLRHHPESLALAPEGTSLWELIALVSQCEAVITPDTGVGHVAAALRVPLAVFFEDAHYTPVVWAPNTPLLHSVVPSMPGNVNQFDRRTARMALQALLSEDRNTGQAAANAR